MPKTTVTVFDVAAYILKEYGSMTTIKLQKLVYYSQAWSLVFDDEPLFGETIEAWIRGPVVRKLFKLTQGEYEIHKLPQNKDDPSKGNPGKLSEEQRKTIDFVVKNYGSLKPKELENLTHQESPWKKARDRGGLEPSERGSERIRHKDMVEYYSSLM